MLISIGMRKILKELLVKSPGTQKESPKSQSAMLSNVSNRCQRKCPTKPTSGTSTTPTPPSLYWSRHHRLPAWSSTRSPLEWLLVVPTVGWCFSGIWGQRRSPLGVRLCVMWKRPIKIPSLILCGRVVRLVRSLSPLQPMERSCSGISKSKKNP